MMCQMIGWPPISTIGLGLSSVSSERRVPSPPARITTFIRADMLPGAPRAAGSASRCGGHAFEVDLDRVIGAPAPREQRRPSLAFLDQVAAQVGICEHRLDRL